MLISYEFYFNLYLSIIISVICITIALLCYSWSKMGRTTATAVTVATSQKDLQDPDGDDSCGGIEWNKFPNYIYGYGRLDCYNAYTNLIKKN